MNCPTCNCENVEVFKGLIKGQLALNYLANFCGRCGTDLRPYHAEIMMFTNMRPLPEKLDDIASQQN